MHAAENRSDFPMKPLVFRFEPVEDFASDSIVPQSYVPFNGPESQFRMRAFADFHRLQARDFVSFETSFGFGRRAEMQRIVVRDHATPAQSDSLILRESISGATLQRKNLEKVTKSKTFQASDSLRSFNTKEFHTLIDEIIVDSHSTASVSEWHQESMELIGLLKHAAPVVYVTPNLPKMDELHKVRTEPLNAFEQRAIEQLKSDASPDVIVQKAPNEIRVVGALRATENCLGCHSVKYGHLLGALTYHFTLKSVIDVHHIHDDELGERILDKLLQTNESDDSELSIPRLGIR